MRRVPVIDTPRLHLRPYRNSDVDALHALWTDPVVRRHLWDDIVITRNRAAQVIQASIDCAAAHGVGQWVVYPAGASALIGFCGLSFIDETPEIQLLYGLAPPYWGCGLATEAAHAVLRHAFSALRRERVYAITDTPNTASVAVMQRLGMQFDARFQHHGLDSLRYVITQEAFASRRRVQPGDADERKGDMAP